MKIHLDFIKDTSRNFQHIENADSVTSLRIWNCKFRNFNFIRDFKNINELNIFSFPDNDFANLISCKDLNNLRICHMPNVNDLSHLGSLKNLTDLSLSTLPSWDSSGKTQIVNSLNPLSSLPKLERLELFGVVAIGKSLDDLKNCLNLKSVRCSKYDKLKTQDFYISTGLSDGYCEKPQQMPLRT